MRRELVKIVAENREIILGIVRKSEQVNELERINSDFIKGLGLDVQDQKKY